MAVPPQLSASLIVTAPMVGRSVTGTHNYRVLMVQRVSKSGSFDGAHVFPGGVLEKKDYDAAPGSHPELPHKLCAVRETLEETGLLFTKPPAIRSWWARDAIAGLRGKAIQEVCVEASTRPADLQLFARWITPRAQKRWRFDTRFYMLSIADDDRFLLDQLERKTLVQTRELVGMNWSSPADLLLANMRGELPLFPPQFAILHEMSKFRRWQDLLALGVSQCEEESAAVESNPIEPLLCFRSDGVVVALLPGDRAYSPDSAKTVEDAELFCQGSAERGLRRLYMNRRAGGGGYDAISLVQTPDTMGPAPAFPAGAPRL
ncbi:hypothetical protein H4217_008971 [Coemansia sp. RSA 1939]|nr:hypothetical protein H4217_008971 [Coemansia sp. RSA 1939]KAJ2589914.1 hypothetical protein EV177_009158 [Coemansia sp. RSA 1804]KAJ2657269.1 hypothetical protein GGH99_007075 [Coemansia sp. RSA 1285]